MAEHGLAESLSRRVIGPKVSRGPKEATQRRTARSIAYRKRNGRREQSKHRARQWFLHPRGAWAMTVHVLAHRSHKVCIPSTKLTGGVTEHVPPAHTEDAVYHN